MSSSYETWFNNAINNNSIILTMLRSAGKFTNIHLILIQMFISQKCNTSTRFIIKRYRRRPLFFYELKMGRWCSQLVTDQVVYSNSWQAINYTLAMRLRLRLGGKPLVVNYNKLYMTNNFYNCTWSIATSSQALLSVFSI